MGNGRSRIESIQVIRAIAFILVFLSHVELISTGPIGVSLFLVLSGFCMTYSYLGTEQRRIQDPSVRNCLRFAWGKVKKLYPLHVITLLLVALVIFGGLLLHKGSEAEIAEQGGYFVANALLLQSWIPWQHGYFSFNAVSWYLSTSAFSYFIFPWVFRAIWSKDRKRIARLAGTTIALMILVAFILEIGKNTWEWQNAIIKWIVYICPVYRAGDFIIGLVAGYIFLTNRQTRGGGGIQHSISEILVVILMIAQVIIYNSNVSQATNWTLTLFWLPTSVLCIYLFAVNKGIVSRTLSKGKTLVWIGNISGETFLIHQICIKAVEYLTKNKWNVAIIAFAITLVATMVWRWLQRKVQMRLFHRQKG